MVLVRRFEERAAQLYRDGAIPGFVHLSIGQEATAVGACWPLGRDDIITSTHRGHGHCLAKGLDPESMFAELLGRETGTCHGRGGSMHIADPGLGIFGANGIVAAGLPIAVGAATAAVVRGDGRVVVAFHGDGAVAQGMFHESVNLARVWSLPVIFFCENNHYAEFSAEAAQHGASLKDRASGYGVDHIAVAGNDVSAVAAVMTDLISDVRTGRGPVIVEADTYRWHGHYEGDPQRYRTATELDDWKQRDPLLIAREQLTAMGCAAPELDALDVELAVEIDAAALAAAEGAEPDPATLLDFVTAPRPKIGPQPACVDDGTTFRVMDAVQSALAHELEHDPSVFLAGIDIGAGGGVFAVTRHLHDRWPDRVRDTPISEMAIMGIAVGGAMAGTRPVVELMYLDFIGVCLDQLMNQAAKLRFMTGGRTTLPLVVRTQFGAGRSAGSQHSQSLEALLAHIPGLTVAMPSTPADTYGMLRAAIQDPNPVIFIENRQIYGMKGPKPPPDHLVPLGSAVVRRPGTDVTVVSVSRMVHDCVAAAAEAATDGIDAEVIDLRTVTPLDRATILTSVRKTGRLVIAHEAVLEFGIGGEIAAFVADEAFWHLDAPIRRIGAAASPPPYAPSLEQAWLPDVARIRQAIVATARV
ncbi:MAG: dehydrogenase E1 component subunit alpha/beta [Acidimicrobiales bacterium]|nr:dehydrogenase E1 component subunit alpha/beta [Acidimicrobiales bacterium]